MNQRQAKEGLKWVEGGDVEVPDRASERTSHLDGKSEIRTPKSEKHSGFFLVILENGNAWTVLVVGDPEPRRGGCAIAWGVSPRLFYAALSGLRRSEFRKY